MAEIAAVDQDLGDPVADHDGGERHIARGNALGQGHEVGLDVEQLAGDLLHDPTLEQRIATGFNRLNKTTEEGGAQEGEYLAKAFADRVRTVSGTWLAITLGCAECHDHKYDPLTTRDFYSLGAFFADVKERGVYPGNGRHEPELSLPTSEQGRQPSPDQTDG